MKEIYWKSKGRAYIRKIGGDTGPVPVGNSAEITIAHDVENINMDNYQTPGGGLQASLSNVKGASISLSTYNVSARNLAIMCAGSYSDVTGGAIVSEPHTVISQDSIVLLDKIPDSTATVTVTGTGGTPSYSTDDFEVRNSGLYIIDGGAITDGTEIEVSYTAKASFKVEALTDASARYELIFDGANEADGNAAVRMNAYICQIAPASAIPLISGDFSQVTLSINMLQDDSKTSSGASKFYSMTVL